MKIIVTCAFGLESLVKRQLLDMGYENLNVNDGRIMLEGDEKDIAKLNINLRCADRVLIELGNFKAVSFEQLFKGVEKINWLDILEALKTVNRLQKRRLSNLFRKNTRWIGSQNPRGDLGLKLVW